MTGRRGSVLVGVLWCLALLSVIVIGVLHTARLDLRVGKNYGDLIQAHYLALAGVEKAKALLYQDMLERRRTQKNHSGELYNSPENFREVPLGPGQFTVFRQGHRDEGKKIFYGISDEESRLNVNKASAGELIKLPGMTPDVIASISDWKDGDNSVTPGGAESEYYSSLQPPYLPRNGSLQTTRELLMVNGVSRELFLGEDANQNGFLDREEDDGDASYPPDNHDGFLDPGWSGLVTVGSSVGNQNAAGEGRTNVKEADEKTLALVRGISPELAKAIVAHRGQKQFESLADLLDVAAPNSQNQSSSQSQSSSTGSGTRGSRPTQTTTRSSSQPSGPKLINEELLMEIADDLTVSDDEQPGAININTASAEVLACLPGVDEQLAQSIVSYRKSAGFLPNIAWLLKVDGMTRETFKQVAPKVSARSETFRILSEGKVNSTGARKRIEVVVRFGTFNYETLSWREDL
jgi:competence ComEA-like helix-hairpin-helix protein